VCLIAESDENDPKLVRSIEGGGYGLDGVWSDDFHHAVHALVTGEQKAYYQDFGRPEQIAKALSEGFVFQGEHFKFWNAPRGHAPGDMDLPRHVFCIQNHDQVGNRATGERLNHLVPRGAHYVAAALLLLAPETPLLFMGEEYGEPAPFQFFTSYSDPELQKAVSKGRREEFKEFGWDEVPDPEDPKTFERSKLDLNVALLGHNPMLRWYRDLIAVRKRMLLRGERTCSADVRPDGLFSMQLPAADARLTVLATLKPVSDKHSRRKLFEAAAPRRWKELLCASDDDYEVRVYEKSS
jgi:maltooligosyltrehalose trehalohydrolase